MGVETTLDLVRHGFYPAGGGEMRAAIVPVAAWRPLDLVQRGARLATRATAVIAGLPGDVAQRELAQLSVRLGPIDQEIRGLPSREGPGNALLVEVRSEAVSELFTGFGEKGRPAETVANQVADEVRRYCEGSACVGEHLADQLVLPIALAGGGRLTTTKASSHLRTNLAVIGRFLDATFDVAEADGMATVTLR